MLASPSIASPSGPKPPQIPEPTPEPTLSALSRVRQTANSIAERVRQALTPEGFKPIRVLVVDDHPDAADALAAVLDLLECPVHACYSGPAALTAAAEFNPDVCLLDLKMPGMDGLELADRLRAHLAHRPPLMVATTALKDAESRARTAKAGFHYHLVKPVDVTTLIETLTELGKLVSRTGTASSDKPPESN